MRGSAAVPLGILIGGALALTWPAWEPPVQSFATSLSRQAQTSIQQGQTEASSVVPSATPGPTPIYFHVATPNATAAGPSPALTQGDCAWAASTLSQDQQLDQAEATGLENGTRQPLNGYSASADAAYYQGLANEWGRALNDARDACSVHAGLLTTSQAQADIGEFDQAISSHESDLSTYHDAPIAWDQQWIANYQRLIALFQEVR